MANGQRDKIEYEFADLRRNEDPIPGNVLDQLGLEDEDLTEDERHEGKKAADDATDMDDLDDLGDTDDADLDEDGEYSPAKMTGAMRKRLQAVKRDAKRDINAAKREAGETIDKLSKRVAELERSGKTDDLDAEFSGKIEAIETKIEAAMEKGDSKEVTKLTMELSEITVDKRMKQRDLETVDAVDDDTDDTVKIQPRAQRWLNEQDWWDDEEYADVRAYVRKADLALQKKGYLPADNDYYEQLEKLVEKKHPGILTLTMDEDFDEALDEDDDEFEDEFDDVPSKRKAARRARKQRSSRRRRSPVTEGDRGGIGRSKKKVLRKKGKTLTRARVKNMQMFGMDPENPDHVEAYLEGV